MIDAARARELFDYDPETGVFRWRKRNGAVAGSIEACGYRVIRVDGQLYKAHRIAWVMTAGAIPAGFQIDHINRIKADNRLSNLRLATPAQNNANCSHRKGRVLPKGVHFDDAKKKFRVILTVGGTQRSFGRYATLAEAVEVRALVADLYHGEFACS